MLKYFLLCLRGGAISLAVAFNFFFFLFLSSPVFLKAKLSTMANVAIRSFCVFGLLMLVLVFCIIVIATTVNPRLFARHDPPTLDWWSSSSSSSSSSMEIISSSSENLTNSSSENIGIKILLSFPPPLRTTKKLPFF